MKKVKRILMGSLLGASICLNLGSVVFAANPPEAPHQAMKEKWDKLTDAQKQEVYVIQDKIDALKAEKINKLCDLGVVDETTKQKMLEHMTQKSQKIKEKGDLPMGHKGKGKHHKGEGKER